VTHDQELQFGKSLTALLPSTKGYARTLLSPAQHYHSLYEDFAQQAMLKAWEHRDQFVPGTNLKAWLFTILRNTIVSHHRRYWRELVTDKAADPQMADETASPESAVSARESLNRLDLLTKEHQEVLTDLGWHGLSYRQLAKRHSVPAGTIKSRVARARDVLAELAGRDELRYGRRIAKRMAAIDVSVAAAR